MSFTPIYQKLIVGKQKAIAAFVVGAVSTFVARHGLNLDASVANYLQAVFVGLLAHLGVYFTRNK